MSRQRITAEEFQTELDNLGLGMAPDGFGVKVQGNGKGLLVQVWWPDGSISKRRFRSLNWDLANHLIVQIEGEWISREGFIDDTKNGGGHG